MSTLASPYDLGGRRACVLVVDDQPGNIMLVNDMLQGHQILMALSGEQALQVCARQVPDLILLDVVMPGMDGLSLCRRLKQHPQTAGIPVIFVTAGRTLEEENACWEAGAIDFISKPINAMTLRNRVNVHLALKFHTDRLAEMAYLDGLTGIANRRHFDERLNSEAGRAHREKRPLALLMLDVDFFKRYNDRYGHQAGDDCLRHVAAAIRSSLLRPGDLAARFGGEEFVCLLPNTDLEAARDVAERIGTAVRAQAIEHLASEVEPVVTVSIGVVADCPQGSEAGAELVSLADQALYRAKQAGRGRVEVHREPSLQAD